MAHGVTVRHKKRYLHVPIPVFILYHYYETALSYEQKTLKDVPFNYSARNLKHFDYGCPACFALLLHNAYALKELLRLRNFYFPFIFLPGSGKKEKMRKGTTHSSAKAKSTPIMSTKIFSDTFGVQNITKQS